MESLFLGLNFFGQSVVLEDHLLKAHGLGVLEVVLSEVDLFAPFVPVLGEEDGSEPLDRPLSLCLEQSRVLLFFPHLPLLLRQPVLCRRLELQLGQRQLLEPERCRRRPSLPLPLPLLFLMRLSHRR